MNTWFEMVLLGENQEHLAAVGEAALDEVTRVENLLSRFDPASEVSRVNRLAAREPQLLSFELATLIECCRAYWETTAAHFDLTAVSQSTFRDQKINFSAVKLDPTLRLIHFTHPAVFLDFGGVGKGYALDRAARIIREFGVQNALLHGGTSSVLGIGTGQGSDGWTVSLRDPFSPGQEAGSVLLRDAGLSSSAVLGEDRKLSDLINPVACHPITEQQACVVLADSATQAEILSTAFLSMGLNAVSAQSHLINAAQAIGWITQSGLKWLP